MYGKFIVNFCSVWSTRNAEFILLRLRILDSKSFE